MGNRIWTLEKLDYIRNNLHLTDKKLSEYFGVSISSVKCARQRNNILNDVKHATPFEDEMIIKYYPDCETKFLSEKLNRPISFLYQRSKILGIKKSESFFDGPYANRLKPGSKIGKKTQYKQGHVPYYKGRKIPPELKEKFKHTFFKKGHKPKNTLHDGAITVRYNKKGNYYRKYIRISENNWQEFQIYNWVNLNGSIPKNHILVCKSNDPLNCDTANWELITREDNMKRNTLHQWPKELADTIKLNNKLKKLTHA